VAAGGDFQLPWPPPLVSRFAFVRVGEMDIDKQARRTRQNVLALAFLVILLLGGAWLFNDLKQSAFVLNCLASGRRDCGQEITLARP